MATDKQIAANRKNAQKSTGPKTPEGRAAVRLNGLKHGLTATTLVLAGESAADFEDLLDSFESEHAPSTPTEEALVRQMAMAQWRLRRLYHVEAAFFSMRLIDTAETAERNYENLEPAGHLALVVDRSAETLTNLSRFEARLERSFYKALQELQRLRSLPKSDLKNQTQSAPQAEPDPGPPGAKVIPITRANTRQTTPPRLGNEPATPDPAPAPS